MKFDSVTKDRICEYAIRHKLSLSETCKYISATYSKTATRSNVGKWLQLYRRKPQCGELEASVGEEGTTSEDGVEEKESLPEGESSSELNSLRANLASAQALLARALASLSQGSGNTTPLDASRLAGVVASLESAVAKREARELARAKLNQDHSGTADLQALIASLPQAQNAASEEAAGGLAATSGEAGEPS